MNPLPPLIMLALLAPLAAAQPQDEWMLHVARDPATGAWSYAPDRIEVYPGATVLIGHIFGPDSHSITGDEGRFDAEGGQEAWPQVRAPAEPGEYAFHCKFHPEMRGLMVVTAREAPNEAPTESAATPGANATPAPHALVLVGAALAAVLLFRRRA